MNPALLDVRAHATAAKDAIAASIGLPLAYDDDEVPGGNHNSGILPDRFAVVSVERRYLPFTRLTGQSGRAGWVVSVQSVGRTADEARWVDWKVTAGLNEVSLPLPGGHRTTLLQHESSDSARFNEDGRYSCLSSFTYTA